MLDDNTRHSRKKEQPSHIFFYSWAMKEGLMEKPVSLVDKEKNDRKYERDIEKYNTACDFSNMIFIIIAVVVVLMCVLQ